MQYKTNTKIIIDKRKLDILLRLNCPKELIVDLIFENKLSLTGDNLIDDNLETLLELKEFKNWGGNHNPTGKNQYSNKSGQVDLTVDLGQDTGQVVDKDIDKDKDKDKDIDKDNNAKIDYYSNPIIEKVFEIYKTHCNKLVTLDKFYKRNIELRKLIASYLEQTESDLEYFTRICDIANGIQKIGNVNIDIKTILRNHDGFYNGKYSYKENATNKRVNDGLF